VSLTAGAKRLVDDTSSAAQGHLVDDAGYERRHNAKAFEVRAAEKRPFSAAAVLV
jgi:hypothetical protein